MTREEIIRMVREARISVPWDQEPVPWVRFEHFAELVAAAERERCAEVCDSIAANAVLGTANECAVAIRKLK